MYWRIAAVTVLITLANAAPINGHIREKSSSDFIREVYSCLKLRDEGREMAARECLALICEDEEADAIFNTEVVRGFAGICKLLQ